MRRSNKNKTFSKKWADTSAAEGIAVHHVLFIYIQNKPMNANAVVDMFSSSKLTFFQRNKVI